MGCASSYMQKRGGHEGTSGITGYVKHEHKKSGASGILQ